MLNTIIFIGRSGCGKGTQAELFKKYIEEKDPHKRKVLYIETGAHFREFIKGPSFSSKLSEEVYSKDERQPDFLACYMWSTMLVEELDSDMHLMFDGAPRSRAEAALLTTAFEFYKREKPTIIYIDVSRKWSEERLLARGRQDDKTAEKIHRRLDWFDHDTQPAVEYFRDNPFYNFIDVNGEQTIEEVHQEIVRAYEK